MTGNLPPTMRLMGFGFYVAFCILGGIVGGVWLDQQVGLAPLFTLVGLFLGLIVAGFGVLRLVQDANNEMEERGE